MGISSIKRKLKAERYGLGRMIRRQGLLIPPRGVHLCGVTREEFPDIMDNMLEELRCEFPQGYEERDLVRVSWRKWLQLWRYRLWPFHF